MKSPADLALLQVRQLHAAGKAEEAEHLCRSLLAADPRSAAALNALALLLKYRGALEEAEKAIRQALAIAPRDPALHSNLGGILRARGDLAAAEKSYRQAIALNRDYAEAFHNLGIVLCEMGRPEEALAAQRRALALRPGYRDAQSQIARLLIDTGDFDGALAAVDTVLRADPKHFAAHYYRSTALRGLDRTDEAVEAASRAVALAPGRFEAHLALGNALSAAHREEEALQSFRRAAELEPAFLPVHREYSQLAWTLAKPDEVYATYSAARGKLGDRPDLLLDEAALRLRLHDAHGAEDLARRALGASSDAPVLLAQALAQQRRFLDAIAILEDVLRTTPDHLVARRELGVAHLLGGTPAEALRVLQDAHRRAPSDQLILAYLTAALRQAGQVGFGDLVDYDRFVRSYDLPLDSVVIGKLAEHLHTLHTRKIEPFDQTLRGGTQTPGALFASHEPEITRLREAISMLVSDYIRSLPDDAAHPFLARKANSFGFAGSWSCRLKSAGFHTNHVHQNGWISSACYVALPDAVSQGEQGWLKFGETNLSLGDGDVPVHKIKPTVGKLVLFPSYYWHGTVPFTDAAPRLTVAFDVVPR